MDLHPTYYSHCSRTMQNCPATHASFSSPLPNCPLSFPRVCHLLQHHVSPRLQPRVSPRLQPRVSPRLQPRVYHRLHVHAWQNWNLVVVRRLSRIRVILPPWQWVVDNPKSIEHFFQRQMFRHLRMNSQRCSNETSVHYCHRELEGNLLTRSPNRWTNLH